jgi:hypothetical protein
MYACMYVCTAEDTNTQKSKVRSPQNNTPNTHTMMPLYTRSSNTGTKVPLAVLLIHVCLYIWVSDYCRGHKHAKIRSQISSKQYTQYAYYDATVHKKHQYRHQSTSFSALNTCVFVYVGLRLLLSTQTQKKSEVRSRQNNTHNTHTTMPLCTRSSNTGTKVPLSVPSIHACMHMWRSDYR